MSGILLFPTSPMLNVRLYARKLICLLAITSVVGVSNAQNNASIFDGTGDYIDCGSNILLNATNINTMECWVNFSDFSPGGGREILSKSTGGAGIELLLFNGNLELYIMGAGAESKVSYSTTNLILNTWYHVAVSWDGLTKESMKLYVNAVPVGTYSTTYGDINLSGISDPGNSFKIGSWTDPGFGPRYFFGSVDEVRVWSTERTQSELKSGMYGNVPVGTTGLIAYYKLNEGTGTTTANSTANTGLDGTIYGSAAWASSPVQSGNNAIFLDGLNDYAVIPSIAAYDFSSGTIECRIKPASVTSDDDCFIASRDGASIRYSFHINNVGIVFRNGTTIDTVLTTFTAGTTYLISLVTNGSTIDAYVNGILAGSFNQTFSSVPGKVILVGSPDSAASNVENFEGLIDEVRLWSTERSSAQILSGGSDLIGNESGLIALFNFNQGISGGTNTGLRIIMDATSNNNFGALYNLALTGSSSNYETELVVLPVRLTSFDVSKNGQNVQVKWQTAQEQNSLKFEIERSSDGSAFTKIGSLAAAGNSSTPKSYSFTDYAPLNGKNFYRLKQIDLDGKAIYTSVKVVTISSNDRLSWTLAGDKSVIVNMLKGKSEKYELIDISGRIIKKGNLNSGRIQFSTLRSGRYIVMIEGAERMTIGFIVP